MVTYTDNDLVMEVFAAGTGLQKYERVTFLRKSDVEIKWTGIRESYIDNNIMLSVLFDDILLRSAENAILEKAMKYIIIYKTALLPLELQ